MPRAVKKFYPQDPNPWINLLGKHGIIVYPEYDTNTQDKFVIAVAQEGKETKFGNKRYTTHTVLDGMYEALEFMYNKVKGDE